MARRVGDFVLRQVRTYSLRRRGRVEEGGAWCASGLPVVRRSAAECKKLSVLRTDDQATAGDCGGGRGQRVCRRADGGPGGGGRLPARPAEPRPLRTAARACRLLRRARRACR